MTGRPAFMRHLTILVLMIILSGCGKSTLVENTTQKRAMQIVIALYKQGISANTVRESGGQGKYSVEVGQEHYAQALASIEREGLLDEPAPSFEELTASSSFFPASREVESLRMDHALGLETKRLIEELPGVEHAQVLVRKRFGSKEELPSVSIVLRTEEGQTIDEGAVVELARRSVPGLEADRVFLSTEKTDTTPGAGATQGVLNAGGKVSYVPLVPFIFKWRVPREDYPGFAALFLICIFVVGAVSILLGYVLGKVRAEREHGGEGESQARIDRNRRDLLEG